MRKIFILPFALCLSFIFSSFLLSSAFAVKYPSGLIVNDENGNFYSIYYYQNGAYDQKYKRYISDIDILNYYTNRGNIVTKVNSADLAEYTTYNWSMNYPCGLFVSSPISKEVFFIYKMVGIGESFSFSQGNFPSYLQTMPDSNFHPLYKSILDNSGITYNNNFTRSNQWYIDGLDVHNLPDCSIVKQTGSDDFYYLSTNAEIATTYAEIDGPAFRKKKITNVEVLEYLKKYLNGSYAEFDITDIPVHESTPLAPLPPGLLIRGLNDPTVYFTDDEGNKVVIPTMKKFNELGFQISDIQYVKQGTLNSNPTIDILD